MDDDPGKGGPSVGPQAGAGATDWASDAFGLPAGDPFGATAGPAPISPIKPPVVWLGLSAAAALVGGFVGWFFGVRLLPALLGWFLAGPVAIGLLARYVWRDTVRRSQPTRIDYPWTTPTYYACLVLAIVATAVVAGVIALWFGRGGLAL